MMLLYFMSCQIIFKIKTTLLRKVFMLQIVVSLVNGRPGSKNFTYSPVLRDFTKATNIRLRFLRTSTLLGHLISKAQRDPTVTRRVRHIFYSLTQRCYAEKTLVLHLGEPNSAQPILELPFC